MYSTQKILLKDTNHMYNIYLNNCVQHYVVLLHDKFFCHSIKPFPSSKLKFIIEHNNQVNKKLCTNTQGNLRKTYNNNLVKPFLDKLYAPNILLKHYVERYLSQKAMYSCNPYRAKISAAHTAIQRLHLNTLLRFKNMLPAADGTYRLTRQHYEHLSLQCISNLGNKHKIKRITNCM